MSTTTARCHADVRGRVRPPHVPRPRGGRFKSSVTVPARELKGMIKRFEANRASDRRSARGLRAERNTTSVSEILCLP